MRDEKKGEGLQGEKKGGVGDRGKDGRNTGGVGGKRGGK